MMLAPGYESFENIPMLLTGKPPILLETDAQFLPDPKKLADLLKQDPTIAAVVLNSPNNPTGAVYERPLLEQLAEVLAHHPDVAVLSDEVYRTLYYDNVPHTSMGSLLPEQTFVVGGMSKEVSGTGLRLGFVAGPQEVMKTLENIQGNASSCVNLPTQKGYARFLREDANLQVRHQIRDGLCRRRDCLLEHFAGAAPDALWHTPRGAFYFFPDMHAYLGLPDCRRAVRRKRPRPRTLSAPDCPCRGNARQPLSATRTPSLCLRRSVGDDRAGDGPSGCGVSEADRELTAGMPRTMPHGTRRVFQDNGAAR